MSATSCSLTRQELQQYPDSLLASIASDCSGSSSSSSSGVNVNLGEVPGWPSELLKPTEAAAVITAMYRTGCFPLAWLQQQLTALGTSDSAVYDKLQQLLAFLNLPGTVLGWVPLTGVTLKHAKAFGFYVNSAVMLVVEGMLSFPLLTGTDSSSGKIPSLAVFLATTTGKDDAPLQVHTVKVTAPEKAAERVSSVLHNCSRARASSAQLHDYGDLYSCHFDQAKAVATSRSTSGDAAGADASSFDASDCEWEPNPWSGCSDEALDGTLASAAHPVFGLPLRGALLEATNSLGLRVGIATIQINDSGRMVDAWVFSW